MYWTHCSAHLSDHPMKCDWQVAWYLPYWIKASLPCVPFSIWHQGKHQGSFTFWFEHHLDDSNILPLWMVSLVVERSFRVEKSQSILSWIRIFMRHKLLFMFGQVIINCLGVSGSTSVAFSCYLYSQYQTKSIREVNINILVRWRNRLALILLFSCHAFALTEEGKRWASSSRGLTSTTDSQVNIHNNHYIPN